MDAWSTLLNSEDRHGIDWEKARTLLLDIVLRIVAIDTASAFPSWMNCETPSRQHSPSLFPLDLLIQQDLAPRLQTRGHCCSSPCPAHGDTHHQRGHGYEKEPNGHERRDDLDSSAPCSKAEGGEGPLVT